MYMDFPSPSWLQYNEQFRMRAAMNPALRWDQVHLPLWIQIIASSRQDIGEHADSGHMVCKSQAMVGSRALARQSRQRCSLCWEFTSQGSCSRKACSFHHECPLCSGPHLFTTCPKPKSRGAGTDGKGEAKVFCCSFQECGKRGPVQLDGVP